MNDYELAENKVDFVYSYRELRNTKKEPCCKKTLWHQPNIIDGGLFVTCNVGYDSITVRLCEDSFAFANIVSEDSVNVDDLGQKYHIFVKDKEIHIEEYNE